MEKLVFSPPQLSHIVTAESGKKNLQQKMSFFLWVNEAHALYAY